jgi:hypothetical protein
MFGSWRPFTGGFHRRCHLVRRELAVAVIEAAHDLAWPRLGVQVGYGAAHFFRTQADVL